MLYNLLPVLAALFSSLALSGSAALFTPPTSVGCSLLIPCTLWQCSSVHSSYQCWLLSSHPLHSLAVQLCSLLLPVLAALSSSWHSHAELFSVHSSYQCWQLSPHPGTLMQSCSLFTPPTSVGSSLLILALSCRVVLCSLLPPVLAALSSSWHSHAELFSVHSSHQCWQLSPHPGTLMQSCSLFTTPTSVGSSLLILALSCRVVLCSLLLPVLAALSSSLAFSETPYLLCNGIHCLIAALSVSLLVAVPLLLCLCAAALLATATSSCI